MPNFARRLYGAAKNLRDPKVFHHMSLVAFLAWVGLGADGLSSSSYGPEEAFKALGHWEPAGCLTAAAGTPCRFVADHGYLAVFLAAMVRIIEEFPHGGGGYIVASKHLGPYVGCVRALGLAAHRERHDVPRDKFSGTHMPRHACRTMRAPGA